MEITFGRSIVRIILTVYFTTFLLNLVGHSSAFYQDMYFEAQVTLNVTIMLVQVTIFTSVSLGISNKVSDKPIFIYIP